MLQIIKLFIIGFTAVIMFSNDTSHMFTIQSAKTVGIIIYHFIRTIKSINFIFITFYHKTFPELKYDLPLNDKNVVVFIHGRNGHYNDFKYLINNINSLNQLTDLYILRTVDLGNTGYTSIDEDVFTLQNKLNIYNNCNITLVGHSKGGVIGLRYMTKKNDARIKKIITISSPLKGTLSASLFPLSSPVRTALGFNNKISQEIENDIVDFNSIYHIVPTWDHLIIPTSSAKYNNTPESNIYYYKDSYSHGTLQYSLEIAQVISDFVRK